MKNTYIVKQTFFAKTTYNIREYEFWISKKEDISFEIHYTWF